MPWFVDHGMYIRRARSIYVKHVSLLQLNCYWFFQALTNLEFEGWLSNIFSSNRWVFWVRNMFKYEIACHIWIDFGRRFNTVETVVRVVRVWKKLAINLKEFPPKKLERKDFRTKSVLYKKTDDEILAGLVRSFCDDRFELREVMFKRKQTEALHILNNWQYYGFLPCIMSYMEKGISRKDCFEINQQ